MNKKLKIAIGMNLQKGAFGGGNQFGKTLSNFLNSRGIDVVFNLADQDINLILLTETRRWLSSCAFDGREVAEYLSQKPNTLVVFRINECDERKGQKIKLLNRFILQHAKLADHVIFISAWLQNLFLRQDSNLKRKSTLILNGADERIFNPIGYQRWARKGPLRLVTHHWGAHWNKGFDIYLALDAQLNKKRQNQIEFTFIGNLPQGIQFKKTKVIIPQSGQMLANEIKKNHVYLTASRSEPAGMHHIEGGLCGLPLLYRQEGALPEYCQGFGIPFRNIQDFPQKLGEMRKNYHIWAQKMLQYPHTANKMAQGYLDLFIALIKRKQKILSERRLTGHKLPSYSATYQILQKTLYLKEKILQ
ncbi:MAG: hypothetical protein PHW01_03105 [Patescibacteria group bacterium]|nr:hypothetical protein [Patescibacteria group bacterium]